MTPPTLLQLGKVNLSDNAYVLGLRDAPLALVGFLANLAFVRGTSPGLRIAASAKALGEAIGAVLFFQKMPRKERAWCGYCIAGAIASVAVFALTLPGALRAVAPLRRSRHASS